MTCAICPYYGFCRVQTEKAPYISKDGWATGIAQYFACERQKKWIKI